MKRLQTLEDVTGDARLPGYRPAAHGVGIVHLGLGAFHRAHQAAITDAALAAEGGDWRIRGVGLRSTAVADALNPQNGLYTLIENGPDGARVIGAIESVIAADPAATLAALCDPSIRIVTLSVTEKGYGIDRESGSPDWSNPTVRADRKMPDTPRGVLGLLAGALGARRAAGTAPFTVLCCDNLPENGRLLKGAVAGFARTFDETLADHIAAKVAFPSSVVDRITPAPTDATLAAAARATGCTDLAAVETEPFSQWVIEDDFPHGRPAWEAGGAIFVDDVAPYEHMKLTMLNGAHSMLAYTGFLCGHIHVRDVMADRRLAVLVERHLKAASLVLPDLPGLDLGDYAAMLLKRFENPAIAHATYQIAMDGTEKLPQRIFAPAMAALAAGRSVRPFAFACAAWMRYALGETDAGTAFALRDPREDEIRAALRGVAREAAALSTALHALPGFVPVGLAAARDWRMHVDDALAVMLRDGMARAIASEAAA